jgi:hypothetical protein
MLELYQAKLWFDFTDKVSMLIENYDIKAPFLLILPSRSLYLGYLDLLANAEVEIIVKPSNIRCLAT